MTVCGAFGADVQPKVLKGHKKGVTSLSVGPGNRLISSSKDGMVKVWNLEKDGIAGPISFNAKHDAMVASAQNGDIAVGLKDHMNSHVFWLSPNGDGGMEQKLIGSHGGDVTGLAFNPKNNNELVSSSQDNTVRLWQKDWQHRPTYLTGHKGPVLSVTFSPNGEQIASGGADKTIRVWNKKTGKEIQRWQAHDGGIDSIAFNPKNENELSSSSSDLTVKLWRVGQKGTPSELAIAKEKIATVSYTPSGDYLVLGAVDGNVYFYDLKNEKIIDKQFKPHKGPISSIKFIDEGQKMITASSVDKDIKVWPTEKFIELLKGAMSLRQLTINSINKSSIDVSRVPPLLLK